jgi:hypothetical protein
MIISTEQVRGALVFLKASALLDEEQDRVSREVDVTPEFLERVAADLRTVPDIRVDRLEAARERLSAGGVSSGDVAEKIIGRLVSDSLR